MRNPSFPYDSVLDEYGDENILFISSNINDYNEFSYNNRIKFYKVTTLDEWFTAINSASLVVANLSAPAVMAHALDKPRIIELPHTPDAYHCMGE
jgi:ADP-heptose:LPS heptosyltransferase